jgi:FkbM family methyltransferase
MGKRAVKLALRKFGIEAHGYIPGSSRDAQLCAAMAHFGIEHVLDIGANEGQFGCELLDSGYCGRIISVEPIIEAHRSLSELARRYPNWAVHSPTAVGATPGEIEFHIAANSVSSSVLRVLTSSVTAAPGSRQVARRVVPLTTVDELVREHKLPRKGAMLKVDTQGYEWAVLDGAAETLGGFELVLLELSLTELYAGQPLWQDIVVRMADAGFGVWAFQPEFVDPATGRTLQVNGLFYRSTAPGSQG